MGRREPRGNQQPRRGKRFENNDENKDGENAENNGQLKENSNRPPRTNDRRRGNDRKSGDPRTGYRSGAQGEKRGGRGKGNWGDKTENPEETAEKPTPEAAAEDAENKDPAKETEEENKEPEVEQEVQLTLEEYMASLNTNAADSKAVKARKANDGDDILKGNVVHSHKIHKERARKFGGVARESNKLVIDSKDLGFQSGANRRGGPTNFYYDGDNNNRRDNRGGRGGRGGNRQGGNRGGDRGQQNNNKGFSMESVGLEAFPTLGGK